MHQEGSQTSDKIPCLLLGGEDMSGCVWEIWSIKWGEGRLGPVLGGRLNVRSVQPLVVLFEASRPGPPLVLQL